MRHLFSSQFQFCRFIYASKVIKELLDYLEAFWFGIFSMYGSNDISVSCLKNFWIVLLYPSLTVSSDAHITSTVQQVASNDTNTIHAYLSPTVNLEEMGK